MSTPETSVLRGFSCVLFAVLGLLAGGCSSVPSQVMTRPDGARVERATNGAGQTIVFQAGLGDGLDTWSPVWGKVAGAGRLVAYSRPGYGRSDPTRRPRDPCSIAHELRALLAELDLSPPYVLVGHSIGGLYQWVFAVLYPQDVKALVLLDPTHPDHWNRLQREAGSAATALRGMRATLFTPTMKAEFDAQLECLDTIDRARARSIPSRLLVRTEYQLFELGAFRSMVESLQGDWLRLVGTDRVEPVSGAAHYLHRDRPDTVAEAIRAAAR